MLTRIYLQLFFGCSAPKLKNIPKAGHASLLLLLLLIQSAAKLNIFSGFYGVIKLYFSQVHRISLDNIEFAQNILDGSSINNLDQPLGLL